MCRFAQILALAMGVIVPSPSAFAGSWSLNLGYQNPYGSTAGLNFLYQGSNWAFETGIGWINASAADKEKDDESDADTTDEKKTKDDDGAKVSIGGDADIKYMFSGSSVRPFIQGGVGVGVGAGTGKHGGAGAGTGGGFAGFGFFFGHSPYAYLSANTAGGGLFVQAGFGASL